MTFNDLVRKHIPNATDEKCEDILCEHTDYPLCSLEEAEKQIIDFIKKNGY